MRWRVGAAVVGVFAVLASGCSSDPVVVPPEHERSARSIEPKFAGAPVLPPPDLTDDGPGSLVDVQPMAVSNMFEVIDATAIRVVYRSTSSDEQPTEVSGTVVVPPGKPPKGGWPVVSYGHNVTGFDERCAPSLAKDLGGYAGPLATLLQRGYLVVMADYQGLGTSSPPHSILDADTLARNLIDATRVAQRVTPTAGTKWAAFGTGEGGLAAWAAAELAPVYGDGLELMGAVALSPFADLTGLVDEAIDGSLSRDQYQLHIQTLQSLANASPGFDLDQYRDGLARERWQVLIDCTPADPLEPKRVRSRLQPAELRPQTEDATVALRQALTEAALPMASAPPADAPILVIYGTEDELIPPQWIKDPVSRSCDKGERIEAMERVGDTSGGNYLSVQIAMGWLKALFDGQRPAAVCNGDG